MQQMISFVPTVPMAANQLPTAGSGQSGAGAGVFQGILLEAMLGARGAQAALQMLPGQPGAAQAGAAQLAVLAAAAAQAGEVLGQGGGTATAQGETGSPGSAPTVPASPDAGTTGLPLRLSGPVAPTPVPLETTPIPQVSEEAEEEVGVQAPAPGTATDPLSLSQIQAVVAAQAQAAQPSAPAPVTDAQAPAPGGSGTPQITPDVVQRDAGLEAFVQKAVQVAKGEAPAATEAPESAQGDTAPTFQDLVKLVMDAGKTGTDGQPAQSDGSGAQFTGQQAPVAEAAAPAVEENAHEPGTVTTSLESAPVSRQNQTAATAEAPQESPRQPVESEQVLRQVTRFIKVMVDARQSEVRLNLYPEHLGHIAVKLVVGDGAIKANLVAQDMAVKAALEANLDQLKTRLSDQGFQVEQVHVSVGSDSGFPQHSRQGDQRQQQQQSHWRPGRGETMTQQDPDPASAQTRPAPAPWSIRGTGVRLNSLA